MPSESNIAVPCTLYREANWILIFGYSIMRLQKGQQMPAKRRIEN